MIEKIKNINVNPRYTLASLDITNLYTNVPVNETLDILQNNLRTHSSLSEDKQEELLILLKLVLKQNYFCFNNEYYIQHEGLAMGSPLSGILAEIFLNDFENKHIWADKNKHKDKIVFFYRYVDDVILLFHGNQRQIALFNNYTNNVHPKLKFTTELEANNELNFLDITIKKDNGKFSFKIYRKPTTTDTTIHATSHHPLSHKMAAYNSFVNRMLKVPLSPEAYHEEKNILKHIAISNGYSPAIIDNLIKKQLNNMSKTNNVNRINSEYVPVEYGSVFPLSLKHEIKKHGKVLAFRTSNKLGKILNTNNNIKELQKKTGIYQVSCNDCDKIYIGQTGRSFEKRFKEHLPRATKSQKSNFAEHLVNENHNYTDISNNLKALHICSKGRTMTTLENYEIYKATKTRPQDLLNDKSTLQSNVLFETLIQLDRNRQS